MTTQEVAHSLVDLCRQGKNVEAITKLYAQDITSVEAVAGPNHPQVLNGLEKVLAMAQWWEENHEVHSGSVSDPVYHGDDRFACVLTYDVTFKPAAKRMNMEEIAVYTVTGGKISKSEFFYDMAKMMK